MAPEGAVYFAFSFFLTVFRVWVWLQGTAQYGSVACLMFAFHRVLRVDRHHFEWTLVAVNAAASMGVSKDYGSLEAMLFRNSLSASSALLTH